MPVEVIDCDNDTEDLCNKYQIRSIPTMLLIDNDEVVERFNGVTSLDDLNNKIKGHL